jgi:hypothetical protein
MDHILSSINPVYSIISYFLQGHIKIILPFTPRPSEWYLSFSFPPPSQLNMNLPVSSIHDTFPSTPPSSLNCIVVCEMLSCHSSPVATSSGNADRSLSWLLHYESCLHGIHAKQVATESKIQQRNANQWAQRLNSHLEMVRTVPALPVGLIAASKRDK